LILESGMRIIAYNACVPLLLVCGNWVAVLYNPTVHSSASDIDPSTLCQSY